MKYFSKKQIKEIAKNLEKAKALYFIGGTAVDRTSTINHHFLQYIKKHGKAASLKFADKKLHKKSFEGPLTISFRIAKDKNKDKYMILTDEWGGMFDQAHHLLNEKGQLIFLYPSSKHRNRNKYRKLFELWLEKYQP